MNVKITTLPDYTLIGVEGRVDTTTSAALEKTLMEAIDGGCTKIILDCSGINYISSSGLRVFLVIQKKMISIKGHFNLCNLQPGIKEIFDISGFSSIFSIFPDKEDAMNG